jgi:hypothetical protein
MTTFARILLRLAERGLREHRERLAHHQRAKLMHEQAVEYHKERAVHYEAEVARLQTRLRAPAEPFAKRVET